MSTEITIYDSFSLNNKLFNLFIFFYQCGQPLLHVFNFETIIFDFLVFKYMTTNKMIFLLKRRFIFSHFEIIMCMNVICFVKIKFIKCSKIWNKTLLNITFLIAKMTAALLLGSSAYAFILVYS